MTAAAQSPRLGRALLLILSAATIAYALGVVVFGVIDLITQLANGDIRPTMYWASDGFRFTDTGDGHSGVQIAGGTGGPIATTVTGVSAGTIAIYVVATLFGLLAQLTLGVFALRLLRRLRSGHPFGSSAWRDVAATSGALLAIGVISQLLAWWSRVAVIADAGGGTFSTGFVFEPLTVTIGLALALVAVAFRTGERIQRDTEGLV
jgi:hypothetical protein